MYRQNRVICPLYRQNRVICPCIRTIQSYLSIDRYSINRMLQRPFVILTHTWKNACVHILYLHGAANRIVVEKHQFDERI